jgi:hypothetical protein
MTFSHPNDPRSSIDATTTDQKTLRDEENKLRLRDADLQIEAASLDQGGVEEPQQVPALTTTKNERQCPFSFVPLKLDGRAHQHSRGSKYLIQNEVTLEDLQKMTDLFYQKAFQDKTIDPFIRSHNDPHADRFAKWIHQKIGGSNLWDLDRRDRGPDAPVHDRTSAHVAAWYSPKRQPSVERGRHFQLDECRVWMRLHFWAMRESGLMEKSPSFCDYYVRFIAHFVNVYESSAPVFARDSLRWSEKIQNIKTYLGDGRRMVDVLGLSLQEAEAQIPYDEANDFEWPYNQNQ